MNFRARWIPALALAAGLLATGCTAQVRNLDHMSVARYDGKALTMADMEKIIRIAAYREDWQTVDLVEPGHFVATKHDAYDKWSATVEILYGPGSYSIRYKDSRGLRYHPTVNTIAHSYKSMVEDLSERIRDTAQSATLADN
jgi:hypothetical protein